MKLRELMKKHDAGGFLYVDRGAVSLGPCFIDWCPASDRAYGDTLMREVNEVEHMDPAINRLAPNGWVSEWVASGFVAGQELRFYF